MKATELYFPVVLFIMLYRSVLTFETLNMKIQKCDHSYESYWVVLSSGPVYFAVKGCAHFQL